MKKVSFLLAIFCVLNTQAQDYLISFAGAGASPTVNNVTVENLTTGTSLSLKGNDVLHLKGLITGDKPVENEQSPGMKVYPNPVAGNSVVEFFPPVAGDAIIAIYDMTGKIVSQLHAYLETSRQEFRLSGSKNGIYFLSVSGKNYKFSQKILWAGNSDGTIRIEKISNNTGNVTAKKSVSDEKGIQATVEMQYSTGDRIKLTGVSDIYTTIIVDVPTTSKLVTFTFIACTDGDGNNYPVIQIGTGKSSPQVWMAVNLKTTKFKDGVTLIPNVTGNAAWQALSTPAYCLYNNDGEYKSTYGALYNWSAVNTGNLCPTGWHVPKDAEWTTLTDYLGGLNVAGGKLKETGTVHWKSPNSGATNETGFTALPAGYRESDGVFYVLGSFNKLWSATEDNSIYARCRYLRSDKGGIERDIFNKKAGLSVRCVKD